MMSFLTLSITTAENERLGKWKEENPNTPFRLPSDFFFKFILFVWVCKYSILYRKCVFNQLKLHKEDFCCLILFFHNYISLDNPDFYYPGSANVWINSILGTTRRKPPPELKGRAIVQLLEFRDMQPMKNEEDSIPGITLPLRTVKTLGKFILSVLL